MKTEPVICYYHSRDLDGWMSAAIVKKKYPHAKFVGWDYGMPVPQLDKNAKIIIVDISFPPEVMNQLDRLADVWIDHHISAINDAGIHGYHNLLGKRDDGFAACELTWFYFFPDDVMPEPVQLLGAYDCFRHKKESPQYQDRVMQFQYAARAFIEDVGDAYEMILTSFSGTDGWLNHGFAIYEYLKTEAKGIFKKAFPVKIKGHLGLLVNRERFNPASFDLEYHSQGYEFFGCFHSTGKKWVFSLYNDNGELDVSQICKQFGGGGHKGAAGFTTTNLEGILDES